MPLIVTVSGSPTADSRSLHLAGHVGALLAHRGFEVVGLEVRDLPAQPLLHGLAEAPGLREAIATVADAAGIVVTTPVYKASYSGALKAFLDVLPYRGLSGKAALAIVSGRLPDHSMALDFTVNPLLAELDARVIARGLFVRDPEAARRPDGGYALTPELEAKLDAAARDFAALVRGA